MALILLETFVLLSLRGQTAARVWRSCSGLQYSRNDSRMHSYLRPLDFDCDTLRTFKHGIPWGLWWDQVRFLEMMKVDESFRKFLVQSYWWRCIDMIKLRLLLEWESGIHPAFFLHPYNFLYDIWLSYFRTCVSSSFFGFERQHDHYHYF